jgi:transcriptional regulator with XRE-family HTH domain
MRKSHMGNSHLPQPGMRKSVYSNESKALAQSLADARKRARLHQADVAKLMGSDQTVISNIERGQRRIDVIEFYLFSKAVGCDPVEMYRSVIEQWESE